MMSFFGGNNVILWYCEMFRYYPLYCSAYGKLQKTEGMINMAEKTIIEFENHLFGIKGKKEGFLKIPKEFYTLTNERLKISKQGVLTETKSDIELFKIKDISVTQKTKDKLMDIGDIEIISADSKDPNITLKRIKGPHEIREKIRAAAKEARDVAGVAYRQDI